ncbi:MAG: carboxylating nicotinate-nucleotide diphosphorylase [Acidobacteriia bacterium]|nr:carboxylating nicotinate-nucleotide diphosphorylase [Terriglobia bacterium]
MNPPSLDPAALRRIVRAAIEEDLGERGDLTTAAVVDAGCRGRGRIVARRETVVAGIPVAREVFLFLDPSLGFDACLPEGERAGAGAVLAEVSGPARPILAGERTALNFLGRMCGIAASARAAVEEVAGTGAVILDTRKTAPGLRILDKYAVAAGGCENHRLGLHDAVMIKDTHLAVAGPVGRAVARALAAGHPAARVTAEVRSLEEMEDAIRAGAGRVLLDNMDVATIRRCVERAAGRVLLEASGGLRPGALRAVAATGVGFLSVGSLTHSVRAADVALEMEALR